MKTGQAVLIVSWIGLLVLSGCTPSQKTSPPPGVVESRDRETELAQLFDRVSSPNLEVADAAAAEVAQLNRSDLGTIGAFWGVRSNDPMVALRIGDALGALSEDGAQSDLTAERAKLAIFWLRRAHDKLDLQRDFVMAAQIRLLMARAWAVQGRTDEAMELLLNRLDPRPLPTELETQFEAMIAALSASPRD